MAVISVANYEYSLRSYFRFYTHLLHTISQHAGLKITARQRTMTVQKCLLSGHFFTSPVILTGHIFMPSNLIADVLN
jgi:hypothetical protein